MPFERGHKFAKGGARPNSGRKSASRHDQVQNLLAGALPEEQVKQILAAMATQAIQGDVRAAALIMPYALGKPATDLSLFEARMQEWQHNAGVWRDCMLEILEEVAPAARARFFARLRELALDETPPALPGLPQ